MTRTDPRAYTSGTPATDEAIAYIKAMITSGEVKPGDRIPREGDLAAAIGLSRNSLREAVRALSLVRVLDVRQGDGTYVSSLDGENLLEALNFLLDFRRDSSVVHFLEVRRILEPAAAGLAALAMSAEHHAALHTLVTQSREVTEISSLVRADLEFHSAIAAGSGNPVLASMVESVSMPTERARVWRGLTEENAVARTVAEHSAIVHAIEAGDSELAAARMLVHVTGVLEWLRGAGKPDAAGAAEAPASGRHPEPAEATRPSIERSTGAAAAPGLSPITRP